MSLRPSNLPKLAVCPCYESDPVAGPAAERGSALDALFRARVQGGSEQCEMFYSPTEADHAAVDWAVVTLRALAGGSEIITREAECSVSVPGIQKPGTADALIPEKLAHADLKTGQPRSYRAQMAAYALGLMEAHFASEWTAYLLYCDQKEVVTHRFTFDEAQALVEEIVRRYHDPNKEPVPCEYCSWCALRQSCSGRLKEAQTAISAVKPGFDFAAILADNETLGKFLTACSVLDDFRDQAESAAVERLQAGADIPGWKLVNRRGPEFINHDDVGRHIGALGFGPVLAAYGNLGAKKFRELWAQKMPAEKRFPEELVRHGKATISLRATHSTHSKPHQTKP